VEDVSDTGSSIGSPEPGRSGLDDVRFPPVGAGPTALGPVGEAPDLDAPPEVPEAELVAPPPEGKPDPPGRAALLHPRSLGNGLAVALVVTGPILLIESDWRGSSLTHEPDGTWLIALLAASASFFAGGAIAGRHRRRIRGAVNQGLALALLADVVLVLVALAAMAARSQGGPTGRSVGWGLILVLWSVVVAVAGSCYGRWTFLRARERTKSRTQG
jgi:hypothetical protein